MKKYDTFLLAVGLLVLLPFLTNANNIPTVKEQLENLNAFWIDKNVDDPILAKHFLLKEEIPLIQLHLSLVEEKLRNKNTAHLSIQQKKNRNNCLDILNQYWKEGVFPQNLYHENRTPYFIDHLGTACAVGQLILSTGHGDIAEKIANENNYGYIFDLKREYPIINDWAKNNGFTTEELAWIQPSYAVCDTTCNQALDISVNGGSPPYSYSWSNGNTTSLATELCPGETYSCTVVDTFGDTITDVTIYFQASLVLSNTFTIPEAQPVFINLTSTDACSCNGSATATVTEGFAPYTYYWQPGGQTTATVTDLCPGNNIVTVMDAIGCTRTENIMVTPLINISLAASPDDGTCIGTATATISGGAPPYFYIWQNGQSTASITGLCDGDYSVTVSDSNGCTHSENVTVELPVSVHVNQTSEFSLFPNPATNSVQVQLDILVDKHATITIYDLNGKPVLKNNLSNNSLDLNVAHLDNGVYFIAVDTGRNMFRKKLIKQH